VSAIAPGQNAREMHRMAKALEAYVVRAAKETVHTLVRTATYGEGRAPGVAVAEGELRGSLRITLNNPTTEKPPERSNARFHPIIGAVEVDQALQGLQLGQVIWLVWIARHALIIEGGRRQDKNGRMIGSLRNPVGFLWLAIDETGSIMRRYRPRKR
jgi:hypothetical protein